MHTCGLEKPHTGTGPLNLMFYICNNFLCSLIRGYFELTLNSNFERVPFIPYILESGHGVHNIYGNGFSSTDGSMQRESVKNNLNVRVARETCDMWQAGRCGRFMCVEHRKYKFLRHQWNMHILLIGIRTEIWINHQRMCRNGKTRTTAALTQAAPSSKS